MQDRTGKAIAHARVILDRQAPADKTRPGSTYPHDLATTHLVEAVCWELAALTERVEALRKTMEAAWDLQNQPGYYSGGD